MFLVHYLILVSLESTHFRIIYSNFFKYTVSHLLYRVEKKLRNRLFFHSLVIIKFLSLTDHWQVSKQRRQFASQNKSIWFEKKSNSWILVRTEFIIIWIKQIKSKLKYNTTIFRGGGGFIFPRFRSIFFQKKLLNLNRFG